MISALVFLAASLWIGLRIERRIRIGDDPWTRLAAAWGIGQVIVTWPLFLLCWAFGFRAITVGAFTALLVAGAGIDAWRSRGSPDHPATALRGSWRPGLARGVSMVLVTTAIALSVWRTGAGDLCVAGACEDFSFHLAMVTGFLHQPGFPPEHPQFAGAPLRYHFMANFQAAALARMGMDPIDAMQMMQVLNALALGVLVGSFFQATLRRRFAALFAVILLLISRAAAWNVALYLAGLPVDDLARGAIPFFSTETVHRVLLHNYFNFDDALSNLFHPQRPFLFGGILAMTLLLLARRIVVEPDRRGVRLLLGCVLLGGLPLFHLHTFAVVGLLYGALLLGLREPPFSRRCLLGLPLVAAVPQLAFLFLVPRPEFFSGFGVGAAVNQIRIADSDVLTRVFFWIRAGGIGLPLGAACGIGLAIRRRLFTVDGWRRLTSGERFVALLGGIGAVFFVLINFYRCTPNWGDSNKFTFYLTISTSLLAGWLLAGWWRRGPAGRVATTTLVVLFAVGPYLVDAAISYRAAVLSLFRADRSANRQRVLFHAPEFAVAAWARASTPRDAIFLTAATMEHSLAPLSGRRVRCGAYVWQNGMADFETIERIMAIYADPSPEALLRDPVDYILVGFRERAFTEVNEDALSRFPVAFRINAPEGEYVVYRVDFARLGSDHPSMRLRDTELIGWDDPRIDDAPAWGRSIATGSVTSCGQRTDPDALVQHAPSRAAFRIEAGARSFASAVGIDDSQLECGGSVRFHVAVDGVEVYASPVMSTNNGPWPVWIGLPEGAEVLELSCDDGGDGDRCDHAVWLDPRLLW